MNDEWTHRFDLQSFTETRSPRWKMALHSRCALHLKLSRHGTLHNITHFIIAIKARNVVTLSVDYELVKPGIGRSGGHSTDTSNPLFIGGNPNSNKLRGIRTNGQFVGCIRNVNINGKSLHFNSSQVMGSVKIDSCLTI